MKRSEGKMEDERYERPKAVAFLYSSRTSTSLGYNSKKIDEGARTY